MYCRYDMMDSDINNIRGGYLATIKNFIPDCIRRNYGIYYRDRKFLMNFQKEINMAKMAEILNVVKQNNKRDIILHSQDILDPYFNELDIIEYITNNDDYIKNNTFLLD